MKVFLFFNLIFYILFFISNTKLLIIFSFLIMNQKQKHNYFLNFLLKVSLNKIKNN